MNRSLPGSSIHGIVQARVLEWVAIAFSEEVSSLSHSIVFLYFFALIIKEGFLIHSSAYGHLGEGNGNPLQYSCLENPMDGGAW